MLIGINGKNQIKQLRDITDVTLKIIKLDELEEKYCFKGWADTKILCYCYNKTEYGVSIYPYIPTTIIEKIEQDNEKIIAQNELIEINTGAIDFIIMNF